MWRIVYALDRLVPSELPIPENKISKSIDYWPVFGYSVKKLEGSLPRSTTYCSVALEQYFQT
jgi:hypothetical protein